MQRDLSALVSVLGFFWPGSRRIFLKWPMCEATFAKFWFASVGAFKELQKLLILQGGSIFFSFFFSSSAATGSAF